jgi:uncharacterized protein YjiS (DUF1127 family)
MSCAGATYSCGSINLDIFRRARAERERGSASTRNTRVSGRRRWWTHRPQIHALLELDDRLLNDVGINRAEAIHANRNPLWDWCASVWTKRTGPSGSARRP